MQYIQPAPYHMSLGTGNNNIQSGSTISSAQIQT